MYQQKIIHHLKIIHQLNEDNSSREYESSSQNGNVIPDNNTQPLPLTLPENLDIITGNKFALVHFITYSNFKGGIYDIQITFKLFFLYINIYHSSFVIVIFDIGFRNLENKEETISVKYPIEREDANKEDGIIRYNCLVPKDNRTNITLAKVISLDFQKPEYNEDINFSEEAALQ